MITDRVQKILEDLRYVQTVLEGVYFKPCKTIPYNGEEPFHDAWMTNETKPFDIRLALAQSAWYASVCPTVEEYQLIIGETLPVAIITYPTGVFNWDFSLNFSLVEKNPRGKEIQEYWKQYMAQREPLSRLSADYATTADIGVYSCHTSLDYSVILDNGINGVKTLVRHYQAQNPQAYDWYESVMIHLDGVSAYIHAHAETYDKAASQYKDRDPSRAAEYKKIAENCYYLAEGHAPNSFWKACQLFWFIFYLNGHDSPGRIDQYLAPALEKELGEGTLKIEEAQEITDCLYCKIAAHIAYGSTIGGQTPLGEDATNQMTWLCLSAIRRLRLLSPRTALRVHKGTPRNLLLYAASSSAEGVTYPTFVNDEVVLPAMERRGVARTHALDYTFCGCGQVIPEGRAYGGYEDIVFNVTKALTMTLHGGKDELHGGMVGVDMGKRVSFVTYIDLEQAVFRQISHLLDVFVAESAYGKQWCAKYMADPLRSIMIHNCLEKGVDFRRGGAEYHDGMVDALGLTTLADSLTVIRVVVYEKKLCTLEELVKACDQNWEGYEQLRQICLNVPKFGNNEDEADMTMLRLIEFLNEDLFNRNTYFGGHWGIDIIGWSGAIAFGHNTGATPNGRKTGDPLADCAGPSQGMDKNGVTAILHSMAKLPMDKVHGPLALSVKFTPDSVRGENSEKLADLIQTYFSMGGMQIQPTVVSSEELRAAQKNPEQWEHLLVRVGGFSAKFIELTSDFQEDMIRRTENEV